MPSFTALMIQSVAGGKVEVRRTELVQEAALFRMKHNRRWEAIMLAVHEGGWSTFFKCNSAWDKSVFPGELPLGWGSYVYPDNMVLFSKLNNEELDPGELQTALERAALHEPQPKPLETLQDSAKEVDSEDDAQSQNTMCSADSFSEEADEEEDEEEEGDCGLGESDTVCDVDAGVVKDLTQVAAEISENATSSR